MEEYETNCAECAKTARWKLVRSTPQGDDWEAVDGSFVCEHWRDHQEAAMRASQSSSGRARVGSVTARRHSAT